MTSRDLSSQRPDWRFLAAISIAFAILAVVATISFQTEQKMAATHSSGAAVNVKPVAANIVGN